MDLKQFNKLDPELYQVWWKDGSCSLAAIGIKPDGDRWIAITESEWSWVGKFRLL